MTPDEDVSPGAGVIAARFCPACGADMTAPAAFVQEFWVADQSNFLCWCARCSTMCTVVFDPELVGSEPEH